MSFTRLATEFKPGAKKQIYLGQHNVQNLDQQRGELIWLKKLHQKEVAGIAIRNIQQ